jgi:vacuolar-type H+-ATPase subunit H
LGRNSGERRVQMENHTLRDIIEVEKEIQQSLEHTKETLRDWLDARRKAAEEELARSEQELLASFQQSRELAMRDAGSRASVLATEAENRAARLTQLQHDLLARIVANHIKKILPG